jgi:CheY-like chemotaxis protein
MRLQGRTVLVVEDDRTVWRAIEELLAREGAFVVQTGDENACEALATAVPPDVVVVDVHALGDVRACLEAAPHVRAVPLVVMPPDIHLWLANHGDAYRRQADHSHPPAQVRTLLSSIEAKLATATR